jgi:hypothetical protein
LRKTENITKKKSLIIYFLNPVLNIFELLEENSRVSTLFPA